MFKQNTQRAIVARTIGNNAAHVAVVDENGDWTGEEFEISREQMSRVRAALWWSRPILDERPGNMWVPPKGTAIVFTRDGSPLDPDGPKLRWCVEAYWKEDLEEIARRNRESAFRLAFLSGGEYVFIVWETTNERSLAEQLLELSREFRRTGDENDFLTQAAKNEEPHTGLQIQVETLGWRKASEEVRAPYHLIDPLNT